MKKIFSMMMIAATLTMLWGCSKSDDDDVNNNGNSNNAGGIHGQKVANAPNWTFKMVPPAGDIEGKPDWKEVNFYDYENNMTAIVFVSDLFDVEMTDDDRMAAIIDGEVREVCAPVNYYIPDVEENLKCFMLYIPYETDEDDVELQYYNAQTNQTYIGEHWFDVDDDTVGDDEVCLFTLRPMISAYFVLPDNVPFTRTEDDELAVFMGDECCGLGELCEEPGLTNFWLVQAFNMNRRHEKAHIRYYSADKKTIYQTDDFLDIKTNIILVSPDTLRFK